ncbi:hypothetical protein C4J92_1189 [Pseudomonas sp. R3-18-08]|nr:hypothetical protein C4J92_1189 [Pseudomonas sp. R3-18-08]
MHKCIYFYQTDALMHEKPDGPEVCRFYADEKNPLVGVMLFT